MPENLSRFIDHARQKGMDAATIAMLLQSSGWKDREIADALAERELGMPIPERAGVGSARDAFLHLLAFTALYAWAISLICLLFTYINVALPDAAERDTSANLSWILASIRTSLAALIVSYPMFLFVWWRLLAEIRKAPELAKSGVRRWLTSLSLFVGAVTIMGDITSVVYWLIEGELTFRFLLKVLTILLVTGGLFAYLAITLRSEAEVRS